MICILGIDLGTTGTTAILFDRESRIKGSGYSEIPQIYPKAGWVEHNPKELWVSIEYAVMEAIRAAEINPKDIQALGVAHQGESILSWDAETNEPFYNSIVWADRRGITCCDELKAVPGFEKEVRKKTGLLVDPYFSSTKIDWLLKNVPEIKKRLSSGHVRIGTLDSWLIWKLSGGQSFFTDYTSASRTMLFNLKTLQWDDELLATFSIPRNVLPEIKPSSYGFGETDPKGLFGCKIPITGAVVDQQGATFGQACFNTGDIKNTYGTSCVTQLNVGSQPYTSNHGLTTTIGVGLDRNIQFAAEGVIYITGAAVQWLRDGLGVIAKADETAAMAYSVPNTLGVYFVPAFVGLASPYWNPHTRGTIVGLTGGVKKEHLVRATLESIAYQVADVIRLMEEETGTSVTQLKVDGGMVVNDFLMQFQSDLLNMPVVIPRVKETTCLGAAYLAGLHVGFWNSLEELKDNWKLERVFTPQIDLASAQELQEGWLHTVRNVIEVYP